jgi:peptidoglycan/LPS O-acetylase OafA/YrhL
MDMPSAEGEFVLEAETKLDGLQIARAIAALSVAYFHSRNAILQFPAEAKQPFEFLNQTGGAGVEFFFAISGYVICLVVARPQFDRVSFAIKRAFRLYPLWILCCAIYWHVSAPTRGTPATDTPSFIFRSFALLPTEGYPILDVGWSLQHELLFYIVAAVLVPVCGVIGLCFWLAIGGIGYHIVEMPWWLHQYASLYPDFLAGVIAYLLRNRLKPFGFMLPFLFGAFGFWLCSTRYGWVYLPIPFVLLIAAFANLKVRSFAGKIGVMLGDASYSIYLWHPIFITEFYMHFSPERYPLWMTEPIRYGMLFAVCVVSIFSWKYYETPLNRLGSRIAKAVTRRRMYESNASS